MTWRPHGDSSSISQTLVSMRVTEHLDCQMYAALYARSFQQKQLYTFIYFCTVGF